MNKTVLTIAAIAIIFTVGNWYISTHSKSGASPSGSTGTESMSPPTTKLVIPTDTSKLNDVFSYNFDGSDRTVPEVGSMSESKDPDWYVNSGAYMYIKNGVGMTIQGELSDSDWRRKNYFDYDAKETDDGYHPQNIFRLVTKKKWQNLFQQADFKINKYILSDSEFRHEPNGLLLFNRYLDGDNLYYTGIRVDGHAIIKKKYKTNYYTMAEKPYYTSSEYNRDTNPNLIPTNTWIGLRSTVVTNPDNTVTINVYIDENKSGNWKLIASAVDDGKKYGGDAILSGGYGGIRTDFMDVEFDNYLIGTIK